MKISLYTVKRKKSGHQGSFKASCSLYIGAQKNICKSTHQNLKMTILGWRNDEIILMKIYI